MSSTNGPPSYPSVAERNFKRLAVADNPGVKYLRHPSGVIVVFLSDEHEAMGKEIAAIEWELFSKSGRSGVDRSKLVVSGKGKKGGLILMPESRLCVIRCRDGSSHTIRSGLKANLVEVNDERLAEDPNLARTASSSHGYLTILMPLGGGGGEGRGGGTGAKEFKSAEGDEAAAATPIQEEEDDVEEEEDEQ